MVSEPVPPDHREADEEADQLGLQIVEGVGEVADVVAVRDVGDPDGDDQEGHRDREQPVAEGEHATELDSVAAVRPPHEDYRPRSRRKPGFSEPSWTKVGGGMSPGLPRIPT